MPLEGALREPGKNTSGLLGVLSPCALQTASPWGCLSSTQIRHVDPMAAALEFRGSSLSHKWFCQLPNHGAGKGRSLALIFSLPHFLSKNKIYQAFSIPAPPWFSGEATKPFQVPIFLGINNSVRLPGQGRAQEGEPPRQGPQRAPLTARKAGAHKSGKMPVNLLCF